MMSVKHVTESGEEFVYPTTHVNFVPAAAKNCAPAWDSVWRYDGDGRSHEMSEGNVYVMNEMGRTVARYSFLDTQTGPLKPSIPGRLVSAAARGE